jgi:hypothetical protein
VNSNGERLCRQYIERDFADHPDLKGGRHADVPLLGKRPATASTY